jgi:hypothetical protein
LAISPPPEEGTSIPLYEPIPFPIPITIGGKEVTLPTGSVLEDVQNGGRITTVSRGDSKVVFNGDTGEVIEWAVQPEDEEDFRLLDTRER